MKRVIGIFLVVLMGLNTIGYYGLLLITQNYLNTATVRKINESGDEIGGHLILRIPANGNDRLEKFISPEFTFNYHGDVWRPFRNRLYKDTLYVYCIRDKSETQVRKIMADYSKSFSNESTAPRQEHKKQIDASAKYYVIRGAEIIGLVNGWNRSQVTEVFPAAYYFTSHSSIFHPPQETT